ncbi:hypothetical protein EHS13_20040 [Paenibacillus psychroresistens]|uniref:Uncharacterized protein n=1 Tax=Paenibacillus psychroresistens TaxID=1778678 RepID=A0A6B8RKT1_9BACL|nr:hypothetical protein [Paenibacillus psychroresistens]QGQ97011.1 hypothetical protein EHS13_20040 [Paenibacillus psychroresistens]
MAMTKEQYLILRKSGIRRNEIQIEYFGNDSITFRTFLSMVGLLPLETELLAIRDFVKPVEIKDEKLPFEPTKRVAKGEKSDTKQKGRKLTFPHVNKEFIEAAFAQGKTAAQIEREEGLNSGTIFSRVSKWGIVNPNANKKVAVQQIVEIKHEPEEIVQEIAENDQGDPVIVQPPELPPNVQTKEVAVETIKDEQLTQFIYFQIPIIKDYLIADRGLADLFGAVQLAATRNIDLVQSAEELFVVMQRYTQLLHVQMETLIVEGNPAEHVQKFIQKHNTIHINKQTATE